MMESIIQKLKDIMVEDQKNRKNELIDELKNEIDKLKTIDDFIKDEIRFFNRHFLKGRIM